MPEEKILYKTERDRASAAISSLNDGNAMDYLGALEEVARAAYEVWKNTPHANKPHTLTVECLNALYDRLVAVNFMDETME